MEQPQGFTESYASLCLVTIDIREPPESKLGFGHPLPTLTIADAAGDNPERLRSEAGFAMLCGAAPLPASSGKTQRHRLNRGGDRDANSALHMVVICRLRSDERTKSYMRRRVSEGLSKLEIIRCLKRYVAREVYMLLRAELAPART